MNNSMTEGQLKATRKLFEQKGGPTERYQALLSSGILADLFECPIETHFTHSPESQNLLRNRIRVSLGQHVKGLKTRVDYRTPFTELVRNNHYHKVRYKMSECDPASMVALPITNKVEEVCFDTIDAESWQNFEEMESDLASRKLRMATPRELVCFDGEYPFVADFLLLCIYTKGVLIGADNPLRISVATNQKPGLERTLSFYPKCLPDNLGGQWVLVVPTTQS